jgi:large subunit ribosomal protein L9
LFRALAEIASDETLEKVAASIKAKAAADAEAKAAAEVVKTKLESTTGIVFKKKMGEKGQIFGSVTAAEVITMTEKVAGVVLGSPKVVLPDIGATGSFDVIFTLHPGVMAVVKIEVSAE